MFTFTRRLLFFHHLVNRFPLPKPPWDQVNGGSTRWFVKYYAILIIQYVSAINLHAGPVL